MKKIFIFDAYSSNRDLLCEELAARGNTVVATGQLEIVRDSVEWLKPDLIILDLYFRGEIRWDLLLEMKAFHPQVPVLIFTGAFHRKTSVSILPMPGYGKPYSSWN